MTGNWIKPLQTMLIVSVLIICASQASACTIFHVIDENGRVLVGRNFDWHNKGGTIWFIPSNGSQNGICILEQYNRDMPFEGINEQRSFYRCGCCTDIKNYVQSI